MLVTLYIILTFDNEWYGVKWVISGIWVLALQLCCILPFLLVVRVSKILAFKVWWCWFEDVRQGLLCLFLLV